MSHIPYHTLGGPGVPSAKVVPSSNAKMVSAYSGHQVASGPVPWGTMSDAPVGHPNHGKAYHGGIQHPSDPNMFMIHRLQPFHR